MALTFSNTIAPFMRGRRGNMGEWDTVTRNLEGATPLYFGNPVQAGADDRGCAPYTSGRFIGISECDQVLPHPGDYYKQYDSVAVCRSGPIAVRVAESVDAGDPAGFDPTYDNNTGGWIVGDTASPGLPGCTFETSGAAGTVVLLRITAPE